MENNQMHVRVNKQNQRVLLMNQIFSVDQLEEFDFDIILILSQEQKYVYEFLKKVRMVIDKFGCLFIKPIFIHPALKRDLHSKQLADGYVMDIDDAELIGKSKLIYSRIDQFCVCDINVNLFDARYMVMQVLRFYYTRGDQLPVPELKHASAFGYSYTIFELFFKYKLLNPGEVSRILSEFIQKGYIATNNFIDKVHLCPNCFHSHILFVETCPQCGRSNIGMSGVIHHFPCANVAPESAYQDGENLRCPKCKKLLRHIGVDYDRPSEIYSCRVCDMSFVQPRLEVVCLKCGTHSAPEQLVPLNMYELSISESGKNMLIEGSVDTVSQETAPYRGLVSFKNFLEQLYSGAELLEITTTLLGKRLFVVRVCLNGNYLDINGIGLVQENVSLLLCETFQGRTISFYKNRFYIFLSDEEEYKLNEDIDGLLPRVKEVMCLTTHNTKEIQVNIDYLSYRQQDDLERFVLNVSRL